LNPYEFHEALLEGRWVPELSVAPKDGSYEAFYVDSSGVRHSKVHYSKSQALDDLNYYIRDKVLEGVITP